MLTAVNGYIDDNRVIVDENLANWQGRKVVVTILESAWNGETSKDVDVNEEKRRTAVQALFGLWRSHENEITVDEEVRNMRRGRSFGS